MWHWIGSEGKFWEPLRQVDDRVAAQVRAQGCPHCGGPLHRADYPRKPRGVPGESEAGFCIRRSLCCGHCRRRLTPPSVRFLGRKVYVGAVVLGACVLWQRVGEVLAGVPRRTVKRWLHGWQVGVPTSAWWQEAQARLMPPVEPTQLPESLLSRFASDAAGALRALVFVSPLSSESAGCVRVDWTHAQDGAW